VQCSVSTPNINILIEKIPMLTPEEVKDKLKDRVPDVVSAGSGLHANTIRALKKGTATKPSYETMKKISDYFEANA